MRRRTAILLGVTAAKVAVAGAAVAHVRSTVAQHRRTPDLPPLPPLGRPAGEERTVVTDDGAELATVVAGSGRDVVLAHGWTADVRTWTPIVDRLVVAGHRVVMFDQRGHGRSGVGTTGYGIAQLGGDLAAVMAAYDVGDAVVMGHSMGGIGVQSLAIHHPDVVADRARSLVLLSTLPRPSVKIPAAIPSALFGSATYQKRRGQPSTLATYFSLRAHGRAPSPTAVEQGRLMFSDAEPTTIIGALEPMLDFDLRPQLPSIDARTLVVCGTDDNVTPIARSIELAALIPGARMEVLDGIGHQVPFEAPDRLAELVIGAAADVPHAA